MREGRAAGEAPRGLEPYVLLWVQDPHEGEATADQEGEGNMMKSGGRCDGKCKSYLVLGRGDVGFAVVSMLRCPAKFTIIERDFSSTEVLKRAGIERADTVIITVGDFPTTERKLKAISNLKAQLGIKPHVLAVVSDEKEVPEAKRLGADEALPYSQVMADFVLARLGS